MKPFRAAAVCSTILAAISLGACADVGPASRGEDVGASGLELESADSTALASATVRVDGKASLGVLSAIAVGANAAAWDSNLVDRGVPKLLEDASI